MRVLFCITAGFLVVVLAGWTYLQIYLTRDTVEKVAAVQAQIQEKRAAYARERAEWAFLNRPDRLAALVESNFPDLLLVPITHEHYGGPGRIPYDPNTPILKNSVLNPEEDGTVSGGSELW